MKRTITVKQYDNHPTQRVLLLGLLLYASLLIGCVSPFQVDYNQAAIERFRKYTCFVIDTAKEPAFFEHLVIRPTSDYFFTDELSTALKARGYVNDCDKPDFRVRLDIVKEVTLSLDFDSPYSSSHHGLHPDIGFLPPPGFDRYERSTFSIDIIDTQSEETIWRGTYAERIDRKPHNQEEVCFIIDQILDQLPHETRDYQ